MRILYFDLDGTILTGSFGAVKTALAKGRFEHAVRASEIDRLICVGNAVKIARQVQLLSVDTDALDMILVLMRDAIENVTWFQERVDLAADPEYRAAEIDLSQDWFYVDDLARHYFDTACLSQQYLEYENSRIYAPNPQDDGDGLIDWLASRNGRNTS